MTTTPELPTGAAVDAVLAARAMADAEHLAGLIVAGQLDTAGRPDRLPADLFPDDDPEVVKRVWQRALVVGIRAGQISQSPRFRRDQLARLQGELEAAGDFAMAGLVGCSRRVADAAPGWHPVDSEEGREH
jgi:hypothetical protein